MRNSAHNHLNERAESAMVTPPESLLDPTATMDGHSECGSMSVSPSEHRYVGNDHWATILENIADLKEHFAQKELGVNDSPYPVPCDSVDGSSSELAFQSPHALLLYGSGYNQAASREDILEALPPRSKPPFMGPAFSKRQYEAFWTNPSEAPVMWIGLLFSMICLAVLASTPSDFLHGHEADQQSQLIDLYREKIVQCLTMGGYTKSGPFVLETLIHYIYVEFGVRTDANKDVWFLLALEVNLAMRMGYHRDPRHFSGISPLQGEMRRRMWATVLLSDILISSQMGMPRIIKESQCDTEEPRNLNDADLSETTISLPPARPETEHTTTLGIIARRRMLMVLGKISDATDAVKLCSYAEILRMDNMLQEAANSIPPTLRMKAITASITDSPQITMSKLFIRHLLYKGQIRLQHRFLYLDSASPSSSLPQHTDYSYSRKACLEASLGTFQIQHVLEEETCPGGQLHSVRWRVTSSMNHLFLTATMILCSLLHKKQTIERQEEICAALRRTREVWVRRSKRSGEARKAAATIDFVLGSRAGDAYSVGDEAACGDHPHRPENTLQQNFQDHIDFSGPDPFMTPNLMDNFPIPSSDQSQGFGFDMGMNGMQADMGLDEWLPMSGSGASW
ncbi:fungal specific transcription factor [Glarea lozoyensis ATCC 20868]|uniref:Fungal specific transcription factor n=1 Tax=Glarea lozoyensis (strain ATCC 20868 / MF5171) TaxID=1116229 RepID=S3EES6_GLAL2|nr:fungal specific transcription factor [Glarea lozoyensis ATCC 20868]EPE36718.1 fungal specific transcription factor [Glarea lozoyensis ATCC 20868]